MKSRLLRKRDGYATGGAEGREGKSASCGGQRLAISQATRCSAHEGSALPAAAYPGFTATQANLKGMKYQY